MRHFNAYAAAVKPERTFFNVLMTLAGFLFVSLPHLDWALPIYTLLGTTLIVMSACAANNFTDRGVDAQMPRTKKRATVTGEVPAHALLTMAATFGLVGFAILLVHVNVLTAVLGAVAYVDYVVLYGWSKRTTPWSTLIGTISGAVPLMAGYTAVTGHLDLDAWLLGLIMVFWQMPHFYAIGVFRLKDYQAGKLPIWPVKYGTRNTQLWILIYVWLYVATVFLLALQENRWPLMAVGVYGLYWLYVGLRRRPTVAPEAWARQMFGVSLFTLLVLAAGLTLVPILA